MRIIATTYDVVGAGEGFFCQKKIKKSALRLNADAVRKILFERVIMSCKDCDFCKITLPVEYGVIKYSSKTGMRLRCTAGLWEDDTTGESREYKVFNFSQLNGMFNRKSFKNYFQLCAERNLNNGDNLLLSSREICAWYFLKTGVKSA